MEVWFACRVDVFRMSSPCFLSPPLARQTNTARFSFSRALARSLARSHSGHTGQTAGSFCASNGGCGVLLLSGKSRGGRVGGGGGSGSGSGGGPGLGDNVMCVLLSRGISCLVVPGGGGGKVGGVTGELDRKFWGGFLVGGKKGRAQGSEFLGAGAAVGWASSWWGQCGAVALLARAASRKQQATKLQGLKGNKPWQDLAAARVGKKQETGPNLAGLGKLFARAGAPGS